MDLIAYALREDFTGTVEQEIDGELVEVPKFSGGVIRAGDLDVNIVEELDAGDGIIVLDARAAGAAVHLDEYPPLKRVKVPEGAVPTGTFEDAGPYRNRTRDEMAGDLATRGIAGTGGAKLEELVAAAEEHDERLAEQSLDEVGAPLTVEKLATWGRVRAGAEEAPVPTSRGEDTPPAIDVGGLSTDELVAVLENDEDAFAQAGEVEVPAAVEELRSRAADNDGAASAALEAHGLANDDTKGD